MHLLAHFHVVRQQRFNLERLAEWDLVLHDVLLPQIVDHRRAVLGAEGPNVTEEG